MHLSPANGSWILQIGTVCRMCLLRLKQVRWANQTLRDGSSGNWSAAQRSWAEMALMTRKPWPEPSTSNSALAFLLAHQGHGQWLLELVVGGASSGNEEPLRLFPSMRPMAPTTSSGFLQAPGPAFPPSAACACGHSRPAVGKALTKRLVKILGCRARRVGEPGHGNHLANAGIAQRSRNAQRIAVKGVELAVVAELLFAALMSSVRSLPQCRSTPPARRWT